MADEHAAAEQAMELDALAAIFGDAFAEAEALPAGWDASAVDGKAYAVSVNDSEAEMQLVFAHTRNYPNERPVWRLRAVQGLGADDIAGATAQLEAAVDAIFADGSGAPIIYDLATTAADWLASHAAARVDERAGPSSEQHRRDDEEAARVAARSHGHPVTPESFAAWRVRIQAECGQTRTKLNDPRRQTGRAWFAAQAGLAIDDDDAEPSSWSGSDKDSTSFETSEDDEQEMLSRLAVG